VDFSILKRAWDYSIPDFLAVATTIGATWAFGVEVGVSAGVGLSIALFLLRTSRPHIAEVGLMEGTEHFRNIKRHEVLTASEVVTYRVDESLYFANARFLEDYIYDRVQPNCGVQHVVLMMSAVNDIDFSALESLESINTRLSEMGIQLHMSEVKGPVMDKLQTAHFLSDMTGQVFLSQYAAITALSPKEAAE
jgi:SulP family sulfate permease